MLEAQPASRESRQIPAGRYLGPITSDSAATAGSASHSPALPPQAPAGNGALGTKRTFAVDQHNHPHASFHHWDQLTGTNTPQAPPLAAKPRGRDVPSSSPGHPSCSTHVDEGHDPEGVGDARDHHAFHRQVVMRQVAWVVRDQGLADVREVAGGVGRGVGEDAVRVREEGVSDQGA